MNKNYDRRVAFSHHYVKTPAARFGNMQPARAIEGLTGSEIEAVFVELLFDAFDQAEPGQLEAALDDMTTRSMTTDQLLKNASNEVVNKSPLKHGDKLATRIPNIEPAEP